MLSRVKLSHLAAAATLAILMGMPAVPNVAVAQDREVRREARDDRREARQENRHAQQRNEARRDRDNNRSRVVIRNGSNDRSRIVVRDRDRDHWRGRSYAQGSSAFIVLGPRTVYRDFGPNWCRGLHRGRHYDRRNGWHAGRHYGPFRC